MTEKYVNSEKGKIEEHQFKTMMGFLGDVDKYATITLGKHKKPEIYYLEIMHSLTGGNHAK